MGRPPKLTRHQRREALSLLANDKETLVQIARAYDVSQMTISRLKQAAG
jgi:DNA-directed RNA polymerase specialized sigma subunit